MGCLVFGEEVASDDDGEEDGVEAEVDSAGGEVKHRVHGFRRTP